jgi:signal transduction histidine kinase
MWLPSSPRLRSKFSMAEIKTQRLDSYVRLIDIARDLASTLDLDVLLNRIVQAAADITAAEAASILLYDNTSRQLYFQVATNIDEPTLRGLVVPLEGSIAGWVVTNRKPLRIENAHEDARHFDDIEQTIGFQTKSILGIPLVTKNKVVGVLEVVNKKRGKFSQVDENLLSVLGAQAAVAIENARLFQQSDLISEFVHELRTPLASLSTATYLLLHPDMPDDQREQIISNIHNETQRLNALASSFLDLARLESGRVQFRKSTFNVMDLLHECSDVMTSKAEEDHIQIRIIEPPSPTLLEADREKIKQVILNLLSNAIKYNRVNGSIILKIDTQEEHKVIISVQDTGVGIPEYAMGHICEKFYRVRENESKAPGTGLGLSICKQIVQGHGGTIEIKSKEGIGTNVLIGLPRSSRAARR